MVRGMDGTDHLGGGVMSGNIFGWVAIAALVIAIIALVLIVT
jgi:uncharacterized membrane protein